MINPRISAVWSTTKPIAPISCTPPVQEVHTEAEVLHSTPRLKCNIQYSSIGNVLGLTIESLQIGVRQSRFNHSLVHYEVHTKDEVVHPTPGHLSLGVIFNTQA